MLSWDRKIVKGETWFFEQVEDFGMFQDFDCNDNDLNDFIHNDARKYREELLAETYAYRFLEDEGNPSAPVAFVSLANDIVPLTKAQKRKLLHYTLRGYDTYPSVKIARLGVHAAAQGMNIGSAVINLIKCIFTTNNRTGCRFVTVNAYNKDKVISFYTKNDFTFLTPEKDEDNRTRFMYFDLKRYKIHKD